MMTNLSRFILGLALTAALLIAGIFAAPAAASNTGTVYVVHGVPGLTVDVYVNGALTLEDFEPKAIAGPLELPEGDYQIDVVPANGSIKEAVISASAFLPAGANVSLVANLDADGTPELSVFVNDVSPVNMRMGRLTARHTAAAPAVDIKLERGNWVGKIKDLSNGMEGTMDRPARTYMATILAAGTDDVVAGPVELGLQPQALTIVYAIGSVADGGSTFDLIVQVIDLTPPAPMTGTAYVVHGVPGLTVDVYVNGALTLEDFAPKTIAGPLELPEGNYDIDIVPANGDPNNPVISGSAFLPAGANVSLVANLDGSGNPVLSVFVNDVSDIYERKGRLTVRHTAAAPAVDIELERYGNFVAEFTNVSNGMEGTAELPARAYDATIFAAGTDVVVVGPVPLGLQPEMLTIVYAIGSLSDGSFDLLVQVIPTMP